MLGLTLAAALAVALLAAYASALARLPQQRAALESLLRSQTGLDVRFAALAVRVGFYGPELHFTSIEMRRPGDAERLLRARELVARFDTWRLLQSGQLRPGRVLLIGAELDAAALQRRRPVAGPRAADAPDPSVSRGAAALERRWITTVGELAAAMPPGRLEFEASTLRWPAAVGGDATVLQIPRLSFDRRSDGLRASGTALLPQRFGRMLFVAVELRGIGRDPRIASRTLGGNVIVQTRAIELGALRDLDAAFAWLPAGRADSRLLLRLQDGVVSQGTLTVAGRDLRLRPAIATGDAPVPIDRLDSTVQFERQSLRWRFATADLRLAAAGLPDRSVAWQFDLDPVSGAAQVDIESLPAAWLQRAALHLYGSRIAADPGATGGSAALAAILARGQLAGEIAGLRYTRAAAPMGAAWRIRADLRGGQWRDAAGSTEIDGLDATVRGESQRWSLLLTAAHDRRAPGLLPQGMLVAQRSADGWRLRSEDLVLAQAGRARVAVNATLLVPAAGDAELDATLRLLAPLDSVDVPQLLQLARGNAEAPWGRRIERLALGAGSVRVHGALPAQGAASFSAEQGDLQIAAASFRPADGWPKVVDARGRARWSAQQLRLDFDAGQIGGLALRSGSVDWRASPRWRLRAQGDVAEAMRLLDASPIAAAAPKELLGLDVSGDAELEFTLASDASVPAAPDRWSTVIRLADASWRPLQSAAPITGLAGELRLADGRLQPSRLRGRWQGGDVRIALGSVGGQPRGSIRGVLPRDALAELTGATLGPDWPASVDWRLDAARRPATRRSAASWQLDGSLAARLRTTLTLTTAKAGELALDRGALRFGAGPLRLPAQRGLQVSGTVSGLDLLRTAMALQLAAQSVDDTLPWSGELRARDLRLIGQLLGDARLQFVQTDAGRSLRIDGGRVAGMADLARAGAAPRLALEQLTLDALPGSSESSPPWSAQTWALDLDVAQLTIAGQRLGHWHGSVAGGPQQIELPALRFADGALRGDGNLRCVRSTGACRFEARWSGVAPRSRWMAEVSEGHAELSWPTASRDRPASSLSGHWSLRAANGRLQPDESPDAPRSTATIEQKLFGPVRALLDTDPAVDEAWAWSRLDIAARLDAGVLRIERYAIDAADRRLQIEGRLWLDDSQVDLLAAWLPPQPFGEAVGRWPAGPALLAAWGAVRDLMPDRRADPEGVAATRFAVTGPLSRLEVTALPLQSAAAP